MPKAVTCSIVPRFTVIGSFLPPFPHSCAGASWDHGPNKLPPLTFLSQGLLLGYPIYDIQLCPCTLCQILCQATNNTKKEYKFQIAHKVQHGLAPAHLYHITSYHSPTHIFFSHMYTSTVPPTRQTLSGHRLFAHAIFSAWNTLSHPFAQVTFQPSGLSLSVTSSEKSFLIMLPR